MYQHSKVHFYHLPIKITRHSFNKVKENLVKDIEDLVSTDLAVFPIYLSIFITFFTDHASKYVTAFGLKRKNETLANLTHYKEVDAIILGIPVKSYHGD